jgi:hypothetical protein
MLGSDNEEDDAEGEDLFEVEEVEVAQASVDEIPDYVDL